MSLKGKSYLDVQNRLIWFIRDQRNLIIAGLAKVPYVVQTEMVEHDSAGKWANFKTFIRDVLGNESTMYGSEGAKDFGDYLEKASTKSLGRALVMLGYGTQFAPEMSEGERVVDSPVERTERQQRTPTPIRQAPVQAVQPSPTAETVDELGAIVEPQKLTPLQQQIKALKDELGLDGKRWDNMKAHATSTEELLAKLQEMADAKRDGFPLDRPAQATRKAAQG